MGIPGSTCATKSSTTTNDEDGKSGGSGKHSRNDERMKDLRKNLFGGEFSVHEKGNQNLQKITNLTAPP